MSETPQSDAPETPAPAVRLSVVVPCYNEQECLPELHRRTAVACEDAVGDAYELVLVDDGSTDRTWALMREISERDPHVVGVKLSRNHGHQLALSAGLTICRGRRILILDADLQDPPELLGAMLETMDAGADVVYGRRRRREGETAFKRCTASLFYRLINRLSDTDIPPQTGDFRLLSRRALDVINRMPEQHRFLRGMVSWIGFRQEPLLYDRDPRYAGRTKYPLSRMLRLAIDAITSFSTKPLRLAGVAALLFALFGVGLLIYAGVSWFAGDPISGWTSLIGAMALLGSIQLVVLAVLGVYLGRLYEQAKGRPLFVIEDIRRTE